MKILNKKNILFSSMQKIYIFLLIISFLYLNPTILLLADSSSDIISENYPINMNSKNLPNNTNPSPPGVTEKSEYQVTSYPLSENSKRIFNTKSYFDEFFNYEKIWKFSTGKKQKIAVIDSGVSNHPRFKKLIPGGDYVSKSKNGLEDLDMHGTAVAGLIAAKPLKEEKNKYYDKFSGIAPDATIISIRTISEFYSLKNSSNIKKQDSLGEVNVLAKAIVHAVDLGANIINISQALCGKSAIGLLDDQLNSAIYHAYKKDVVVVMSAGNVGQNECNDNPITADSKISLQNQYNNQSTFVSPARFSQVGITVGAVDNHGVPWQGSIKGPWVTVAAPGTGLISLNALYKKFYSTNKNPNQQLTDKIINTENPSAGTPLTGTSFATPLVTGLVALLREKFPKYTAGDIINLIKKTASGSTHNNSTGFGVIDPLAALTFNTNSKTSNSKHKSFNFIANNQTEKSSTNNKTILIIIPIIIFIGISIWMILNTLSTKKEEYKDDF